MRTCGGTRSTNMLWGREVHGEFINGLTYVRCFKPWS